MAGKVRRPLLVRIEEKEYKEALTKLVSSTVVELDDFDDKCIKYLDYVQAHGGRGPVAVENLHKILEKVTQEHWTNISRKPQYIYGLLKKYDKDTYDAMKEEEVAKWKARQAAGTEGGKGAERPRRARDKDEKGNDEASEGSKPLNPDAPAFVPGQSWSTGAHAATPVYQYPAYPYYTGGAPVAAGYR